MVCCSRRKEEKLWAALDREERQLLEDMLTELPQSHMIELEAMFCSPLALGWELAVLAP